MLAIIFKTDETTFSISGSFIQEIVGMIKIDYFKSEDNKVDAIINYKGKNIPTIDISKLLNQKRKIYNTENIIIIVNYYGQEIAILADDVLDKIEIETNEIKAFETITSEYLPAFFDFEEKVIPLLNIKKIALDIKEDLEKEKT